MKKKLLVSFSGGETSAFMAQWLWRNKQDEYDMIFVFANTGQENEETLSFVENFSKFFGIQVVWVEAVAHHGSRKGCTHKIVSFKTASRNGEPFEDVIKKYGIPNQSFPHCTRELKLNPINSYAKSIGWKGYYTAVGIRSDEADRMIKTAKKKRLIYPLINKDMITMTKPEINIFWKLQPFRLQLKGYQGNCKTCWKKADSKLFTIAQESPEKFKFMDEMEYKYPRVGAEFIKYKNMPDRTFFRKHRSTQEVLEQSKNWDGTVEDDADLIGGDSCEIYSSCGD